LYAAAAANAVASDRQQGRDARGGFRAEVDPDWTAWAATREIVGVNAFDAAGEAI
jgi:hypothetical protein